MGGAVRRLRQRRPVGHRRVHLLRRGQVGPAQRRRPAAPARPRGPGPGPQLRPDRAVPAAVRRGLDDRRAAQRTGELLPPAAPARPRRGAPPAGGVHAEVDAAQPGRGQPGVRLHRRPVPHGDRRPALPRERRPRRRRPPHPPVQRQDLLGARRRPRQAQGRRHRDRADRAALPGAAPPARGRPRALPEREGRALGAGGAGEPGPVALLRARAAGEAARAAGRAQARSRAGGWPRPRRGRRRSTRSSRPTSSRRPSRDGLAA